MCGFCEIRSRSRSRLGFEREILRFLNSDKVDDVNA